MFPVAYIPAWWFKVMDQRLLALPHIKGDMTKINIDPAKRDALLKQYAA
jgi:alkane 1-monooxygenase